MKNILTIMKKEFKRFFTDRRMIMSLILPGIIIFALYSLMGNFMGKLTNVEEDYVYKLVIANYDDKLDTYFEFLTGNKFDVTFIENDDDSNFPLLENKELDLYVVYPDNFYEDARDYDPNVSGNGNSPIVKIYYNSSKFESYNLYNLYTSGLLSFQGQISEKFRMNALDEKYDFASENSSTIQIVTMLVPFLLITFLFSGAMSISIESIAGEKERGTIATLLATPVKRNEIALGKIIALSVVSLLSAASSFLGLMLSMPKLMQGVEVNLNIYEIEHYLLLFLVLIITNILYVVLISLVSTYAKSTKEANSLSSVLMIINMVTGVSSLGGFTSTTNTASYFIPIFNSVQSIGSILSLELNIVNLLITAGVNLLIVTLGIFLLTRMFNSEKIMFNK